MSLACPAVIAMLDQRLCSAVDHYCERTSAAFDAEPINAFTNAAFLIAALAAWWMARLHDRRHGALMRTMPWLIALVGIGSFVFHTLATRWAEWADVVPILLFILVYVWLFLTHFFAWPAAAKAKAVAVTLLVGSTLAIEVLVPSSFLWGGALYLPTVATLLAFGGVLLRTEPAAGLTFFVATLTFLLSFAARTLDMPLCGAIPGGTHFLWHVLNATVLYLLARTLIVHAPRGT
jgi:hypothetical protein